MSSVVPSSLPSTQPANVPESVGLDDTTFTVVESVLQDGDTASSDPVTPASPQPCLQRTHHSVDLSPVRALREEDDEEPSTQRFTQEDILAIVQAHRRAMGDKVALEKPHEDGPRDMTREGAKSQ